MVKALLEYGADIRMVSADPNPPQSPLEWAIQSEEPQMVSYVLSLSSPTAGNVLTARGFFQRQRRREEQRNIFPDDKYAEIERLLFSSAN